MQEHTWGVVENITQFCWKYSSSFQQWKNFENRARLRFEKVISKSLVASFFGTRCICNPSKYERALKKYMLSRWLARSATICYNRIAKLYEWKRSLDLPRCHVGLTDGERLLRLSSYHYKPSIAVLDMHRLTCGISSLLHSVNLTVFTLLLVHLILRAITSSSVPTFPLIRLHGRIMFIASLCMISLVIVQISACAPTVPSSKFYNDVELSENHNNEAADGTDFRRYV